MEFRMMLIITLYAEQKKKDTDLQNSLLDSVGEGEGGMFQDNSIETCILSRVKQITSPGWMHETRARTWCTGKTQRERVEREVGGGIGMGNTCKPLAVSFQCMTKSTTKKKKKKRMNLSMEFSRQEHWSRQPFASLGDLPNSELQAKSLLSESAGKPQIMNDDLTGLVSLLAQ